MHLLLVSVQAHTSENETSWNKILHASFSLSFHRYFLVERRMTRETPKASAFNDYIFYTIESEYLFSFSVKHLDATQFRGRSGKFSFWGSKLLFRKGCWTFLWQITSQRDGQVFLNLWTPVTVDEGNTALRTWRTYHRGVPKNNYILEYPWNFVWLQNATHVCIKKISQWKSDIRFCWCKNFSLKQGSGLMGGGGGGVRKPLTLLDPPLQLECLSFVTHGEDLPEILGEITTQESKQIPLKVDMRRLKTLRFSLGSAWSSGVLSCPIVRANSGKVSLGDVTAHSRVQDWLRRERLGTRDNKGNDLLSTTAKCREVTYHPVSSLSSFSLSFSLSPSCSSSSSSSSTDWKSLDWKSASSARFYMENQGVKKASSHESVEYDRPGK